MKRILQVITAASITLTLTACLIPEKFVATIRFKPDGTYNYRYDGTAVHLAGAVHNGKGPIPPKDEIAMKADAKKAKESPGIKRMDYQGDGRFDVLIDQDVTKEEASDLAGIERQSAKPLRIFKVYRDKAGTYSVTSMSMKPKDRDQFKALGIKVNGTAEVFLPSNAKILKHNATGTPGLFSKSYSWKIGGVDDQPSIEFSLAQ
ncbi:hypothetical protein [Limnohabitans sp.]|uniref:hypothetical protein n=1 Tax=Limnohabitans sp. TaxID=1907725 RepID=UPI00289BAC1F|nr:hypothetical protein [Limnohabitans sp.]